MFKELLEEFEKMSAELSPEELDKYASEQMEKLAGKDFKKLQKNKVQLTPEERKQVMDRKAVWHFNGGSPSPAVWKSVDPKTGETTYVTHTHRAYNTAPTLKGAIGRFHSFIKSTASDNLSADDIEKLAAGKIHRLVDKKTGMIKQMKNMRNPRQTKQRRGRDVKRLGRFYRYLNDLLRRDSHYIKEILRSQYQDEKSKVKEFFKEDK